MSPSDHELNAPALPPNEAVIEPGALAPPLPTTLEDAIAVIKQLQQERDAALKSVARSEQDRKEALSTVAGLGYMVVKRGVETNEQAEAKQRLVRWNIFDPETGLFRKESFENFVLPHRVAGAEKDPNAGFSLLHFDLTNFKLVNDLLSHSYGDVILRKVGIAIADSVRTDAEPHIAGKERRAQDIVVYGETYEIEVEDDVAGHLNGDHYAVLVNEVDPQNLDIILNRIIKSVEETLVRENQLIKGSGQEFQVTISGGVATFEPGMTEEEISAAAEAAMKVHKDHQHANKNIGRYRQS